MEYVQMTLNDWVQIKQKLKQELLGVKRSFVRIGYFLRKIDEEKLYENDGYKSITDFAKSEYGLEPSTTSRFMSINREYSIDGFSERLRPEFEELKRSQLEEMLALPDADRAMIQPETPRTAIRELKQFNKQEPEPGVADDISQLVEKFYKDNPDILNAVFSEKFEEQTIKRFAEIVNPGGSRSYKKGLFFLMMYENRVTVKKFGGNPQDMTWWEFYRITVDIFGAADAGAETWKRYFEGGDDGLQETAGDDVPDREAGPERGEADKETSGAGKAAMGGDVQKFGTAEETIEGDASGEAAGEEPDGEADRGNRESDEGNGTAVGIEEDDTAAGDDEAMQRRDAPDDTEQSGHEQPAAKKERIAPAQKIPEILEKEVEKQEKDGICDTGIPESRTESIPDEASEKVQAGKTRKEYLDGLTAYGASLEIAKAVIKSGDMNLSSHSFWEQWLNTEVDEWGEEISNG